MTKQGTKLLSLFLVALFFMNVVVTPIFSQESEMKDSSQTNEMKDDIIIDDIVIDDVLTEEYVGLDSLEMMKPGDKTLEELKDLKVDIETLPEVIDKENAIKKGHVNRLYEQEGNLNTIIYQNTDGTKTSYIFNRPVKYIAADGSIKDKSTKLSSLVDPCFIYGMTENSVNVWFPEVTSNPTKITYKDYTITMTPCAERVSEYVINGNTILYPGVFGENTAISYTPKLNGVKEDIILFENIGQNTFSFTMVTEGLSFIEKEDSWYSVDSNDSIIGLVVYVPQAYEIMNVKYIYS